MQTNITTPLPAWIETARGPHNEIYSPPLLDDMSPRGAVAELVAANERLGQPIHVAKRGQALAGLENVAVLYAHQMQLRQALAGELDANPVARALREAVVGRGEPLSLNPLTLEGLRFATFAAVFQCLTPAASSGSALQWRVGLIGWGQVEEFAEASPARALARAQKLYVEWSAADDAEFDALVKRALDNLPPSLFHDYWLALIDERESWDFGGGHRLTMLGRHVTMQLDMPAGRRILETERGRAVRIADALARQAGATPDWPTGLHIRAWLAEENAPTPEQVEWSMGPGGLPARVAFGGREYALVKRQNTLVFHEVRGGQYVSRLAETALEPPIAAWLEQADPDGRLALIGWALWKGNRRP